MRLPNLFRVAKALFLALKVVRRQHTLGVELAALPMPRLVADCLDHLNASHGVWQGRARPPHPQAKAVAADLDLPPDLAQFYACCNGYEAVHGKFPAAILPIESLRTGAACSPALSARLERHWAGENDTDVEGLLSVFPCNNLGALIAGPESYFTADIVDPALLLRRPSATDFTVLLLADTSAAMPKGHVLPRGSVLEIEGGAATSYPDFRHWLGSRASLFGSLANPSGNRREGSAGSRLP